MKSNFLDKDHDILLRLALLTYVGRTCEKCGRKYESVDQLIEAAPVWVENGKLECKRCVKNDPI